LSYSSTLQRVCACCTSLCVVRVLLCVRACVVVGVMVEGGVLSTPCPRAWTLPPLLGPTPALLVHPPQHCVPSPCCCGAPPCCGWTPWAHENTPGAVRLCQGCDCGWVG